MRSTYTAWVLVLAAGLPAAAQLVNADWNKDDGDFKWATAGNWAPNGVPNASNKSARFLNVITDARAINVENPYDLGQLVFGTDDAKKKYTLYGAGELRFTNATQNRILIRDGNKAVHTVAVDMRVDGSDLVLDSEAANLTSFDQRVVLSGEMRQGAADRALRVRGKGWYDMQTEINFLKGGTFIEGGRLHVKSDLSLGFFDTDLSMTGGVLSVENGFDATRKVKLTNSEGGLQPVIETDAGISKFKGVISGTGGVFFSGKGTAVLSADNTFTGNMFVSGGVSVSKATNFGGGNADIIIGAPFDASIAVLSVTDNVTTARNMVAIDVGTVKVDKNKKFSIAKLDGVNPGEGNLVKDGDGTFELTGNANNAIKRLFVNGGIIDVLGRIGTSDGILCTNTGKLRVIQGGGTIQSQIITDKEVKLRPKKGNKESVEWHMDQIGDLTIAEDTSFEMGITMAGGAAGQTLGWGLWNLTGNLLLSNTPSDPMTVELASLDTADNPWYVADFDPAQAYAWKFIGVSGGVISGFDPGAFVVDASQFWNLTYGGAFSVSMSSDGLYVNFTPAPTPGAAAVFGFAGALGTRRRRR